MGQRSRRFEDENRLHRRALNIKTTEEEEGNAAKMCHKPMSIVKEDDVDAINIMQLYQSWMAFEH